MFLCRSTDLSQQVGRDQPDEDPGAGGGVRQEVPEKTQTRLSVVSLVSRARTDSNRLL